MKFIERISRHLQTDLLEELTLTTNGSQLRRFSNDLYKLGVRRINVSLDTLNEEKFSKVTRWGRLSQVLDGIQAAQDAGLRVKINTVALRNFNEDELFSITDWCSSKNLDLTFIEVMPMGELEQEDRKSQYWSLKDLRNKLEENYSLYDLEENTGGPARYVKVKETQQKIGFITPLTHNFCESCNRVRVTCTGELFMCLGQENNANLRDTIRQCPNNPERLESAIRSAINNKPKVNNFINIRPITNEKSFFIPLNWLILSIKNQYSLLKLSALMPFQKRVYSCCCYILSLIHI